MIGHYDKDGSVLSLEEWAKKFEDSTYKRIAETTLQDGQWVSTVWLGLDYSFGDGDPLIFETVIFKSAEDLDELDRARYPTLEATQAGHQAMVEKWESDASP